MNGFIPGSRGTLMLDIVAVAMILVLPLIAAAINLAKRGEYQKHRVMMLVISTVLAVTVVLFEIEMRMVGWRDFAAASPYFNTLVTPILVIHLACSITTTALLIVTVMGAVKKFPNPPRPGAYSQTHRKVGKAAAVGLALTSITGWIFYWCAFIAT